MELGFTASKADTSLFVLHKDSSVTLILVYVDDIILAGSDTSYLEHLVTMLSSRFMKDLGFLHYFLGIEVVFTKTGLFLSQSKYASEILGKAGMTNCKPSVSPTSAKTIVDPAKPFFEDVTLFRTLVGSLQYLTLTRPEIAFLVNAICQHMHKPKVSHFSDVKRILRYIKRTLNHGLYLWSFGFNRIC